METRALQLPPTILFEKRDHIAIVTINRPDAMNALTKEMLLGIDRAFAEIEDDPELWVSILTAAGDKAFCCGMDLKEAIPAMTAGDSLGYDDPTKRQFSDVFKPIIAAVNGLCIAGGLETLLATDLRIAAEHARFGLGEVRWGLVPAGGSHVRLPQQMPWAMAMQLLLTGEPIDAKRAYEAGLVNEVVPLERLLPRAIELADRQGDRRARAGARARLRARARARGEGLRLRRREGRPPRVRGEEAADLQRSLERS
jgi:enoyl-CoA hydratase